MSTRYVVLLGESEFGEVKTALVDFDTFEEDRDPNSYFKPGTKNTQKTGEVEISGDDHLLPSWISDE